MQCGASSSASHLWGGEDDAASLLILPRPGRIITPVTPSLRRTLCSVGGGGGERGGEVNVILGVKGDG